MLNNVLYSSWWENFVNVSLPNAIKTYPCGYNLFEVTDDLVKKYQKGREDSKEITIYYLREFKFYFQNVGNSREDRERNFTDREWEDNSDPLVLLEIDWKVYNPENRNNAGGWPYLVRYNIPPIVLPVAAAAVAVNNDDATNNANANLQLE
jgi:hypothetical protein